VAKAVIKVKVLVVYYSRSGNTEKMARAVAAGVEETGVPVELKPVSQAKAEDLLEADGIILGSPTYYGTLAAEMKALIDSSVRYHGKLEGKVGGAFTSSGGIGTGNETTILSLLQALLVHGMIVQGAASGDHYGAVAVRAPDEKALEQCRQLGARVARLVKTLQR
jgi:NAD(P)H dehydrogenase (quinone)